MYAICPEQVLQGYRDDLLGSGGEEGARKQVEAWLNPKGAISSWLVSFLGIPSIARDSMLIPSGLSRIRSPSPRFRLGNRTRCYQTQEYARQTVKVVLYVHGRSVKVFWLMCWLARREQKLTWIIRIPFIFRSRRRS